MNKKRIVLSKILVFFFCYCTLNVVINLFIGSITELEVLKINGTLKSLILVIFGLLAPIIVVGSRYLFLRVVTYIFNIRKIGNEDIFYLSTIAYIPILIGSIINLISTLIFGFREFGYTTMLSFIQTSSKWVNSIYMKVNLFEILSAMLLCRMFIKKIDGSKKDASLLFLGWYIIDNLVSILF